MSALHRQALLPILLVLILLMSGCGMGQRVRPTPTPTPSPTPTPAPTATPVPADSGVAAAAVATPQVTVPANFQSVLDERLAYSLAVPRGWSELDLRSAQVQTIAGFLGLGEQLEPLNTFLDSPEGQAFGKIYVTDLTAAMFGGLPSLLNVSVLDAPGITADAAATMVQDLIEQNISAIGNDVVVNGVDATVINNLPAVEASATANLAAIGMDGRVYGRVVALLANDKVYVLTILVPEDQQAAKAAELDQIIGTFRPE
ncbi:MAG: hypothetical protein R2932_03340 [Caldilineaceae bacterium]